MRGCSMVELRAGLRYMRAGCGAAVRGGRMRIRAHNDATSGLRHILGEHMSPLSVGDRGVQAVCSCLALV